MPDSEVSIRSAVAMLGALAVLGIGMLIVFVIMNKEPDPLHSDRRRERWQEPIQQEANPDAVRIPPPTIKPLELPKGLTTRPATLPTTRPASGPT
jgi:hypothetical protein